MSYHFSQFSASRGLRSTYRFATNGMGGYRSGLIWRDIQVLDLSPEGIRFSGGVRLRIGQKLQLRLPVLGKVECIVRWLMANSAGCQFVTPVDPVLVDAYVLKSPEK